MDPTTPQTRRASRLTLIRPLSASAATRSHSSVSATTTTRTISRLPPGDELYFAQAFPASPPLPIHPLLSSLRSGRDGVGQGLMAQLAATSGSATSAAAASRFVVSRHRPNDVEVHQRFEELEALRYVAKF